MDYGQAALSQVGSLSTLVNKSQYIPVGFRDSGYVGRDNTNQTGTTRQQLFPQLECQDLVFVYSNYNGVNLAPAANTNSINVKASLEINGAPPIPVFFKGKRTVTIDPGAVIYTDPIGCMISPTDSVFVRTYWDAGVSGYVPQFCTLCQVITNNVMDGIQYGVDLTDSGAVANIDYALGFVPTAVLGIVKGNPAAVLLAGDSIQTGSGDTPQLYGNSGFGARALLKQKIPNSKICMPGDKAQNFLSSVFCRAPVMQNHTHVIFEYGTNDIAAGLSLAAIQATSLKCWKYLANKGLIVYQTTITPKTTSTDNFLTLANQTVSATESVRLAFNAWLRDTSSNGAIAQSGGTLYKIIDSAAKVEVSGKWMQFSASYTGTVQSATANQLTDSNLPFGIRTLDNAAYVKITGGTGVGQTVAINNNVSTTTLIMKANWTTIPDATSTYSIIYIPTSDGTHPSSYTYGLMEAAIVL